MSDPLRHSYRFTTEAHWRRCLFESADRAGKGAATALQPFAPFAGPGMRLDDAAAYAPAASALGFIYWRDAEATLFRAEAGDDVEVEQFGAPHAIAHTNRLVATPTALWAVSPRTGTVWRFDAETHAAVLEVDVAGVVDISGDGHEGVFALVAGTSGWRIVPIDCAGHTGNPIELAELRSASAFVHLAGSGEFAVLASREEELLGFSGRGGSPRWRVAAASLRPCFRVDALGSDGRARVLVAGRDGEKFGGWTHVLILDGDGGKLGELGLGVADERVNGVAAAGRRLFVAGPRGLLQFAASSVVPDGAEEIRAGVITPVLTGPDRDDARRWLRIEAVAHLPQGAALEIAFAASEDEEVRQRMVEVAGDESRSMAQRAQQLRSEPGIWRTPPVVFHGQESVPGKEATYSAPLFGVRERFMWASITLIAGPGATLPSLSSLSVLYPGATLMQHLPAIYKRAESQPGNFLRGLVGVLETTTQALDARIGSLGALVHPTSARGPWLDFVARWLELPWDDALSDTQKRCIVEHAAELLRLRGTRAGLETLLACLVPGAPRRFRITDLTADLGFATVGDDRCPGSALPALLGGPTRWSAELDTRAVVGRMRLPCEGEREDDGVSALTGRIRIDVAASAEEREVWKPWLLTLIDQMVPLTTSVALQWVSAHALRSQRLDEDGIRLDGPPTAHLGTDAVTGLARLPERDHPFAGIRLL